MTKEEYVLKDGDQIILTGKQLKEYRAILIQETKTGKYD